MYNEQILAQFFNFFLNISDENVLIYTGWAKSRYTVIVNYCILTFGPPCI